MSQVAQGATEIQTSSRKCSPGFWENFPEQVMFEPNPEGEVSVVWGGVCVLGWENA